MLVFAVIVYLSMGLNVHMVLGGIVVLAYVELCVKWDLNFFHFSSLDSKIDRVGLLRGFGDVGRWRSGGVEELPAREVDSGAIFPGGEVREGVAFGDDGGPGPAETAVSGSYHCN